MELNNLLEVHRETIKNEVTGYLEEHYFPFLQNDPQERFEIKQDLGRIMRNMVEMNVLQDYKVVCDETNNPVELVDQNMLRVDIFVQPLHRVHYINFSCTVVPERINEHNLSKDPKGQIFCDIDPYGEEIWEDYEICSP